jgi:hypothetical protein
MFHTALRYTVPVVGDAPEITVLQLRKFKAEATDLIGADGIEALAAYLVDRPEAGDLIPGSGGVRQAAMGSEGQWEARWGQNCLFVRCDRSLDLPASVLREERKNRSYAGREETAAADRGSFEGSAIVWPERPVQGNRRLARN